MYKIIILMERGTDVHEVGILRWMEAFIAINYFEKRNSARWSCVWSTRARECVCVRVPTLYYAMGVGTIR